MGTLTHLCDDTRSDWNARSPTGPLRSVKLSRRIEFFNHYIGPGAPDFAHQSHEACLKQVRRWQKEHQTKAPPKGPWKDIGYNALVCGHARVIEGRGLEVRGSHCPDHNRIGFGVQFMVAGNERPTPAMFARMRKLYDELVDLTGPLAMRGHRDGISTSCPGEKVYDWVLDGMPGTPSSTSVARFATTDPTEEDDVTPEDKKEIIDGVWTRLIARPGNDTPVTAGSHIGNANVLAFRANKRLAGLEAKVVALTAAVEALAAAGPAGGADVSVIVDNAVRDRLNTMPLNEDDDSFDLDASPEDDV